MKYLLFAFVLFIFIQSLLADIADKSTHRRYKFIRKMFWKSKKRKLLKNVPPLLAYPLAIEVSFSNTLRDVYLNEGLERFIEVVEEKVNNIVHTLFTPPKRTKQRAIEYMQQLRKKRNELNAEEIQFIDNYEKQEKESSNQKLLK